MPRPEYEDVVIVVGKDHLRKSFRLLSREDIRKEIEEFEKSVLRDSQMNGGEQNVV